MRIQGRALKVAKAAARWTLSTITSARAVQVIGEPIFRLVGTRTKGGALDVSLVKRALVVRPDEIGDVVMTTPFLRELRRLFPEAWITLVVKPAVFNLVERCPYVNEVLTYDWSVSPYCGPLQRHWRALRLARRHFWRRRFDLAIVPRWDADDHHATFVAYFSGAPWRLGYSENVIDRKRRLNAGLDRLFTHVLDENSLKHEVQHNLDVVRFLGGTVQEDRLELWMSPDDEAFAEQVLRSHGIRHGDPLIAFSPGARHPKRMWLLANFAEVGIWLKRKYHAHIVIVGEQGEESLGQELQQQIGGAVINVVGQTTLRQAGALLKRCHLFVGNDAGPMHLAAASGVPVVEISCHPLAGSPTHQNSPRRFGPWSVPHHTLQPEKALSSCSQACDAGQAHCILRITVEQVKEAVVAQLAPCDASNHGRLAYSPGAAAVFRRSQPGI
ncbi:MAG: glycosyltransferase family 9 protein [Candidatus Methylomirabilis oxyfera]|nr:glycosyltransferase family 9 protein [Candidatus Methylomirabilis oxyfera]